jgi:hypothetical protein
MIAVVVIAVAAGGGFFAWQNNQARGLKSRVNPSTHGTDGSIYGDGDLDL